MQNTNLETTKQNRMTIYLVILIAFLIISVVLATFAYFSTTQDLDQSIPVNVNTASKMSTFTARSTGEIEFILTAIDMSEANISTTELKSDNGNVIVDVASATDDETTTCTYDIVWVWEENSDVYTTPTTPLKDASNNYLVKDDDGKTYPFEFSVKLDGVEKDISEFTLNTTDNSFVIGSETIVATNTTLVTKQSVVDVKIYNLPVDQKALFNKSFRAHLEVRNYKCNAVSNT